MMGLGSFSGGGPSSSPSSSNLSALAPPFTVDRSNSKPSTASLLQFSESPYATGFGHTWQYANPPASRTDVHQKPELEADSTKTKPVTSVNDYHFGYFVSQSDNKQSNHWSTVNPSSKTASDAFLFDPKVETYYPRYVSPVVDEGTPLVALSDPNYDVLPSSGFVSANASTQVDYTQSLSGLEYTPNWGSVCYGVVDAKRGKHAKLDGSFVAESSNVSDSVSYTNYLNQGCNMVQCENMPEEDSVSSYRQFSDVIMGRESSKHLVRMEHANNISLLHQQALSLPFDSSTTSISSSSIPTSESLPPGPSLQSPKNYSNYQNLYDPYGKGNQSISSCFSTSVSVMKSSPMLVFRPPPVGTGLALQKSSSGQSVEIVDVASVHHNAGLGNKSPARGKEPQILQNKEGAGGFLYTGNIKSHNGEIDKVFSISSAVEGPRSKVQNKDTSIPVLGISSGSQFMNVNAWDSSSLSGDSVLAIKSSENCVDCLDHHNPAVDSPCWKGAPSSHFAPFDAVETNSSHDFMKKLDECYRLDLQVQPPFPPLHDPIASHSEKAAKDKVHHHDYGSASTEQITVDMPKGIPILTSNKGIQICEEFSEADSLLIFSDDKQLGVEEYNFATKKPNLQDAVMDAVMSVNDPTEGGAVAVLAAENVLCSPSSEESASEQMNPYKREATPRMDVQTLINAMQNLSDLLVFSCSSNDCALKEQDHKVLKHVMSNLDSLLSQKMVYMTQGKEPILPQQQDNSENVAEYRHPHKSTGAGKPQFENKAPMKLEGQLDYQQNSHEKKSASFQPFPSLMTDLDVLDDDNISQAIKKVLNGNSYFGEEEHSQALLFKSLWLEAEAKLYSISYRARFDRMKIEMERLKSKEVKDVTENIAAFKKISKSETSPASNTSILPPTDVERVSVPKTAPQASSCHVDNVEATVVGQLHELSCCEDLKPFNLVPEPEPDDVEASVMTRFHILKRRDDRNPVIPVEQQADMAPCVCSDDSMTQSPGNSEKRTQNSIGSTDNSSSDWEHVLKEDISWR